MRLIFKVGKPLPDFLSQYFFRTSLYLLKYEGLIFQGSTDQTEIALSLLFFG